jgi:hypothetical protein
LCPKLAEQLTRAHSRRSAPLHEWLVDGPAAEPLPAMILFTKGLHRRYHAAGISTAAFHPGDVATNFGNESHTWWIRTAFRGPIKRLALVGPEQGSDELVSLASSTPGADWKSGEYYANHAIARANPRAYDSVLARELWERSLAMVTN